MSHTLMTKELLEDILQVSNFGKKIEKVEQLEDGSIKITYNDSDDSNLPLWYGGAPYQLTKMGEEELDAEKRMTFIQVPQGSDAEEAARELREIFEEDFFVRG